MLDTKRFRGIIDSFYQQLLATKPEMTDTVLSEDKWSLREIVGHLVDSASNNHQRFVRLQFDDLLGFPAYEGEAWLKAQKYNGLDWEALVSLWYGYNRLLLHIIENTDRTVLGNVWVKGEEAITLEFLMSDYYRHLEEHVEHFNKRREEIRSSGK